MRKYPLIAAFLITVVTLALSCRKKSEQPYIPPGNPKGVPQQPLDFQASGSRAGQPVLFTINRKSFTTASWDFGDGSPRLYTGPGIYTHVFAAGTYIVTLIVDGDSVNAVKKTIAITPYYAFSVTGEMVADDTLTFVPVAYPATGNIYDWNFGDGSTSTVEQPIHSYTAEGSYAVKLIVNGDNDYSVTQTLTITKDPVYTKHMSGKRTFHDCKMVTRPVGSPAFSSDLGDSILDFIFLDKLTLKLNWDTYVFSAGKSSADVVCFDKSFVGSRNVNGIVPGSLSYFPANDSFYFSNVTQGTIKGGSSGNVYDYTFTCHTP